MAPGISFERLASIVGATRPPASTSAALVALTGIDGCGKGYVAAGLARALEATGHRVAVLNVDRWLNLPAVRFSSVSPAEHFYRHAIRFEEMFTQLVLPLRDRGAVCVESLVTEETATEFRPQLFTFEAVTVILLEGIYLLKRDLQSYYDLSVWIDCSYQTALARAVTRGQEGLSAGDTARAYRTIYFPAQSIHFARDAPRAAAGLVVRNDPSASVMAGAPPGLAEPLASIRPVRRLHARGEVYSAGSRHGADPFDSD